MGDVHGVITTTGAYALDILITKAHALASGALASNFVIHVDFGPSIETAVYGTCSTWSCLCRFRGTDNIDQSQKGWRAFKWELMNCE